MVDKIQILSQVKDFALAKFNQLRPAMTATLTKAYKELGALCAASETCEKLGVSTVTKEFTGGLSDVLAGLNAFRSGYASNDPSQQIDPKAVPGFAPTNTVKATETGSRVSPEAFVKYAAGVLTASDSLPLSEALDSLSAIVAICNKSIGEDVSAGVLIPTSNDPDAVKTTSDVGTVTTLAAGTSAPSNASSNFATNADAIGGPAPAVTSSPTTVLTAPNAPLRDPTVVPAPAAGTGPAVATSAVTTAVAGSDGHSPAPENASFAKTATPAVAPEAVAFDWSDLAKSARKPAKVVGWADDLNSPSFLNRG